MTVPSGRVQVTRRSLGACVTGSEPRSVITEVSPRHMLRSVRLFSRIMCRNSHGSRAECPTDNVPVIGRKIMKFKTCSLAGITIWLAFAFSGQAGPTFDLFGLVPGGDFFNINQSPFPVDQFLSGTDGFIGSGSVFAKAKLGELGIKATVVNTALPIKWQSSARDGV